MTQYPLKTIFYLYAGMVLILAVFPFNNSAALNDVHIVHLRGDYFVHMLLFLPWAFFKPAIKLRLWLLFLTGLVFATGTEALQYLLPYRSYNINDMLANVAGVVFSTGLFMGWRRMR